VHAVPLTPADPWGVTWSNFTDWLIGPAAQGSELRTGKANTAVVDAPFGRFAHRARRLLCASAGIPRWHLQCRHARQPEC